MKAVFGSTPVRAVHSMKLDSGSDTHVCPRHFGRHFGLETRDGPEMVDAQGNAIESYGQRTIRGAMLDADGREKGAAIRFEVGSVEGRHPLGRQAGGQGPGYRAQ